MNIPAMNLGVQGMQRGLDGLRENAHAIANAGTGTASDPGDVTRPLVDNISDRSQVEASAKVVGTADDMVGTLLDVLA